MDYGIINSYDQSTILSHTQLRRYASKKKPRRFSNKFLAKWDGKCTDCGQPIPIRTQAQLILMEDVTTKKWIKQGIKHFKCPDNGGF